MKPRLYSVSYLYGVRGMLPLRLSRWYILTTPTFGWPCAPHTAPISDPLQTFIPRW